MPDQRPTDDRTPVQRQADHASLARLSESLVPALVQKLSSSGLGELEVREGGWRIRLRRAASSSAAPRRLAERPRLGTHVDREGRGREASPADPSTPRPLAPASGSPVEAGPLRTMVTSPAVGVFRAEAAVGDRVRAGDRIASVDLLGIPQDVTAPIDGTVVEVLAQTGEAVEFGEEVAAVAPEVTVETDGPPTGAAPADAAADEPALGGAEADPGGEASA
jgi:biotin carboxyl carrier protein